MTKLKQKPNLAELQKYVLRVSEERGFSDETAPALFMLLLEECGELAKAARKVSKVKIDKKSKQYNLEEELADVFLYVLEISNHFGIDIEKA